MKANSCQISVICRYKRDSARKKQGFVGFSQLLPRRWQCACWVQARLPLVQVVQSKLLNENMERKLRGNSQYLANLEARLQHEIVKAAPLLSSNLDALPTPQLQQLVTAQEEALKRARSMLVNPLVLPCVTPTLIVCLLGLVSWETNCVAFQCATCILRAASDPDTLVSLITLYSWLVVSCVW